MPTAHFPLEPQAYCGRNQAERGKDSPVSGVVQEDLGPCLPSTRGLTEVKNPVVWSCATLPFQNDCSPFPECAGGTLWGLAFPFSWVDLFECSLPPSVIVIIIFGHFLMNFVLISIFFSFELFKVIPLPPPR